MTQRDSNLPTIDSTTDTNSTSSSLLNTSEISLRYLGNSGLQVTPIGLGCWQFGKRHNLIGRYWPEIDTNTIRQVVKTSLDNGINWFDTAEVYGHGVSEQTLSDALQWVGVKPGEVIVATKWWSVLRRAESLQRTIDRRLSALKPYPIDLYQVHHSYAFSSVREQMKRMADLVREKEIRYIGVSNFSVSRMYDAADELHKHGLKLVSNQVRYSLLNRRIEKSGMLEAAKEMGISLIAYSALAHGLLSGRYHDNPELINDIGWQKNAMVFKPENMMQSRPIIELLKRFAFKYGVTVAQVALNWVIHVHGNIIVAIPGATNQLQAEENAGAMQFQLTAEEIEELSLTSSI